MQSVEMSFRVFNEAGQYITWQQMLGLCTVIFAISEFIEKNKFRSYALKFSGFSILFYWLIGLAIFCVVIATFIPIAYPSRLPYIPYISTTTFWELACLASFTICVIFLIYISIFNPIPRLNYFNHQRLLAGISRVIVNDDSKESMSAIAIIVDENMNRIMKYASQYDDWWNVKGSKHKTPFERFKVKKYKEALVLRSVSFIKNSLSDERFCNYISRSSPYFIYRLVDRLNKYSLPHSCQYFLMDSIYRELFINDDSHLSREMDYRGVGLDKHIFNKIFSSLALIHSSNPYSLSVLDFESRKNEKVVAKYITALEISTRQYFTDGNMYGVSNEIGMGFKGIADTMRWICSDLRDMKNGDIYENRHRSAIMKIEFFYSRLHHIITGDDRFQPQFDEGEIEISNDSLMEAVAVSIFNYLDALTILKSTSYARHLSCCVFWCIFPVQDQTRIERNLSNRVLELIKERIEENKKGFYSSMIGLLLNIYGFNMNNSEAKKTSIEQYFYDEFKSNLAQFILRNQDAKHLPDKYTLNRNMGTIENMKGEIIYQDHNQWLM